MHAQETVCSSVSTQSPKLELTVNVKHDKPPGFSPKPTVNKNGNMNQKFPFGGWRHGSAVKEYWSLLQRSLDWLPEQTWPLTSICICASMGCNTLF